MTEEWVEKLVIGALKTTIKAHGPIDLKWIASAAKRIAHQIFGELKAHAAKGEGHEICEAKIRELEKEIKHQVRKNGALNKSRAYWMAAAGATEEDEIKRLQEEKKDVEEN